jgi:hypothetical protein
MCSLIHTIALCIFIANAIIFATAQRTGAPSDSPQDSDIYQSSYLGGEHNIDPSDLTHFTQLWNATFNPDEKVFCHFYTLPFLPRLHQHSTGHAPSSTPSPPAVARFYSLHQPKTASEPLMQKPGSCCMSAKSLHHGQWTKPTAQHTSAKRSG